MAEDVIIIGSGPAGLAAALYTAREDFKPLVINGVNSGGQLLLTTTVENYPAFPNGVLGTELVSLMKQQAERFGARFIDGDVSNIDLSKRPFKVTVDSKTYESKTLIIATGASARWLGIPSEKKFVGKGVSSCATCLPPHSLIVSNPSVHEIQNFKQGQKVLTHDGTFKTVEEVMVRDYSGDLVQIGTRFFRSEKTRLTPNHPVMIVRLERGIGANYHNFKWSKPVWVNAEKAKKGDILMYPIPKEERDKTLDIAKELGIKKSEEGNAVLEKETYSSHRVPSKIVIDKEFSLLVGYYLADGYSHNRGISFAFNYKEVEYAEDCARIIKNIFGLDSNIKREHSVLKVSTYSKILSMFFEKLFGKYSYEKGLPDYFVLLKKPLQKELIKGFWRGDGSIRNKDFVLTTSSRVLVEQLKIIMLRLDILPTVEKRKFETLEYSIIEGRKVTFKHDVYQLIIGGPSLNKMSEVLGVIHPIILVRKRFNEHGWIRNGFAYLPIREVSREPYRGLVYNLAVKENGTYVTTSGIVHNCDAPFYKGKDVVVVGGGDTAMEDSNFLTKFANSVTIVHRKEEFRASKIMQNRILANPKIKVIYNTVVDEILGDTKVSGVRLKNMGNDEVSTMQVQGVFMAIGYTPNTAFLAGKLELDDQGYIVVKDEVKTDIEGCFVAGDVADRRYRQAVTAAAAGVKAALEVREYLQNN